MDEQRFARLDGFAGACPDDYPRLPTPKNKIILIVNAQAERPYVWWFGADTRVKPGRREVTVRFTRIPYPDPTNMKQSIERLAGILIETFVFMRKIDKTSPLGNALAFWKKGGVRKGRAKGPAATRLIPHFDAPGFIRSAFLSKGHHYVLRNEIRASFDVVVLGAGCLQPSIRPLKDLTDLQPEKRVIPASFSATADDPDSVESISDQHGLSSAELGACCEAFSEGRARLEGSKTQGRDWGLPRFLSILREQGAEVDAEQYQDLDSLFVHHRHFWKIYDILSDQGIVFIVAPPYFGKTYTAAYLLWGLWRYYEHREPRWLFAKPLTGEPGFAPPWPDVVDEPETSLVDFIHTNTGPDIVTFIEDPFGRRSRGEVRWSRLDPAEMISAFVDYVRNGTTNARVIVTSRDVLFDEAIGQASKLNASVVRLGRTADLYAPATYSSGDKHVLLREYARLYGCRWFNEELPQEFMSQVKNRLETPHSIALFCKLTSSATTPEECMPHLGDATRDIVKAFANEICTLDDAALSFVLTIACCRWASKASIKVGGLDPSLFLRVFMACFNGDVGDAREACSAAADRLKHRIFWRGLKSAAFFYNAYLKALDMLLDVPRVRQLFNRMISAMARAPDHRDNSLAASMLARMAASGRADSVTRQLLQEHFGGSTETGQALALDLSGSWNSLDVWFRDQIKTVLLDQQREGMALSAALGLAFEVGDLDERGCALLHEVLNHGSPFVRRAAGGTFGQVYGRLNEEGRALVESLILDLEDKGVLMKLLDEMAREFRVESCVGHTIDAASLALVRKLASSGDRDVSAFATSVLEEASP